MGDHETTGTQGQSNPTSQVGTHGNAEAGDRMGQGMDKDYGQGTGTSQGSTTGAGQRQDPKTGAAWTDQQPGYAGGTKDDEMTPGGATSRPESGSTNATQGQDRSKA